MATIIKKGASKSEIAKTLRKASGKNPNKALMKLAGSLKAAINPLEYLQELRDEWQ